MLVLTTPRKVAFMSLQFQDTKKSFSQSLTDLIAALPQDKVTVRELLSLIGEHGLLLFCMILTIPFLTPLPLPGVSTVFGLIIMLISLGVIFNRVPWLPNALMKREMESEGLKPVLNSGAKLFIQIERVIRPRLLALTGNAVMNRFNGIMLFIGGALLILPLPILPFSNTLPGWAVLVLAAGILQRDGLLILLGYVLNIATILYFGIVALGVIAAGGSILELFRESTSFIPLILSLLK